ncbi:MAG: hypothetical protein IT569_05345 [Leptospiraceae bacterium]|nr:hypothetical protein [Leptospiraceae bacterium]
MIDRKTLKRFCNSFRTETMSDRKGKCNPEKCETLDGRLGHACCRLGSFNCVFLNKDCSVYKFRPPNCRVFPRTESDLELVKNCGYSFGIKERKRFRKTIRRKLK